MSEPLTIDQAERLERAAIAAIDALGRREIEAVKSWIASGCEGDQPRPDEAERERLARALSEAMEARQASNLTAGGRSGNEPADVASLSVAGAEA